jgi:hypothetical protein
LSFVFVQGADRLKMNAPFFGMATAGVRWNRCKVSDGVRREGVGG